MFDAYIKEKIPAHLSKEEIDVLGKLIPLASMPKDRGESTKKLMYNWAEDDEPTTARLDSWATMSMRTEKKRVGEAGSADERLSSRPDSASSLSSRLNFTTIGMLKSRFKAASRKVHERQEAAAAQKEPEAAAQKEKKKATRQTTAAAKDKNVNPPEVEALIKRQETDEGEKVEENPIEEKLRRDKELSNLQKKMEAERKAKKLSDDAAFADYVKRMQNTMKTKDYTYDFEGNILVLADRRSELQSNDVVQLPFGETAPELLKSSIPREPPKDGPNSKYQPKAYPHVKKSENGFRRHELEKEEHVQFIMDYKNPTISEVLQPKEGVKLILEDGKFKENMLAPMMEGKMRKAEYDRLVKENPKTNPKYLEVQLPSGHTSSKKTPSPLPPAEIELLNVNMAGSGVHIEQKELLAKMLVDEARVDLRALADRQAELEAAEKMQKTKKDSKKRIRSDLDRVVSYKKLEDSAKEKSLPKSPKEQHELNRTNSSLIPTYVKKFHKKVDDFNDQLLHDNMWGSNLNEQSTGKKEPQTKSPRLNAKPMTSAANRKSRERLRFPPIHKQT
eukprot:TRINITY_DN13331_c0_g1_i3.p1 TRINITY_DN13331_c0_g1~~TRINITY_DN13331_c0_g1_i3.p1  ORF type:complete len:561 (-),score=169.93 TRINITY_DN13331_c0_g1_i3:10-1692(-)